MDLVLRFLEKFNDMNERQDSSAAMNPDIPGKYIHEKTGSHYLELKPDGSYFLFQGFTAVSGTYEVNGAEITIFGADSSSQADIQGGVITDSDGDRWIRAKAKEEAIHLKCPKCNSDLAEGARFCSSCGAPANPTGGALLAKENRQVRIVTAGTAQKASKSTTESATVDDDPLPSMSWLPAILRRSDFPWELVEAAGFLLVMLLLLLFARP